MPVLPPAYHRDAARIAEIVNNLVEVGRNQPDLIPSARSLAAELRAFLTRWQNQPAVADHSDLLNNFRSKLLTTERHIEALHIATLRELLEFRQTCLNSANVLHLSRHLVDLFELASPEEREQALQQLRETQPTEFTLNAAVQTAAAKLALDDSEFERLIDDYERLWPDRLEDDQYLAILDLQPEEHDALAEELNLLSSALDDPPA